MRWIQNKKMGGSWTESPLPEDKLTSDPRISISDIDEPKHIEENTRPPGKLCG